MTGWFHVCWIIVSASSLCCFSCGERQHCSAFRWLKYRSFHIWKPDLILLPIHWLIWTKISVSILPVSARGLVAVRWLACSFQSFSRHHCWVFLFWQMHLSSICAFAFITMRTHFWCSNCFTVCFRKRVHRKKDDQQHSVEEAVDPLSYVCFFVFSAFQINVFFIW